MNYFTDRAPHFLHSQLKEDVWIHPDVLKDSLDLIRIVRATLRNGADYAHGSGCQ
jgi:hypothetical protein